MTAVTIERIARLNALVDSSPVGQTFYDLDLRYMRVNRAMASSIQRSPDQFIGRSVRDMLPAVADVVEALLRQVRDTGEPTPAQLISSEMPAGPVCGGSTSRRYGCPAPRWPSDPSPSP